MYFDCYQSNIIIIVFILIIMLIALFNPPSFFYNRSENRINNDKKIDND